MSVDRHNKDENNANHVHLCSEHTDFSESTEEIAPLTEEEKIAKLDELRERLKAKRAVQSVQDKEESKRNEVWQLYYPF
jgi:hypothetical protein